MNKFYYKSLLIFIIFVSSFNTTKSQCVVCVEAPPLITCGESATLLGEGYITSTYSDDFNGWSSPTSPSSLWANVSTGGTTNSNCTDHLLLLVRVQDLPLGVIFGGSWVNGT